MTFGTYIIGFAVLLLVVLAIRWILDKKNEREVRDFVAPLRDAPVTEDIPSPPQFS